MKKLIFLIGWGLGICLPAVQAEAQQLVVLDLEKTIRLANDSSLDVLTLLIMRMNICTNPDNIYFFVGRMCGRSSNMSKK